MKIEAINSKEALEVNKTKEAAQKWESYFISMLLKEMRKTIPKDGLFGDSQAMQTFNGMLDNQLADVISENGGFGFSDYMYKGLFKNQVQKVNQQNVDKLYT